MMMKLNELPNWVRVISFLIIVIFVINLVLYFRPPSVNQNAENSRYIRSRIDTNCELSLSQTGNQMLSDLGGDIYIWDLSPVFRNEQIANVYWNKRSEWSPINDYVAVASPAGADGNSVVYIWESDSGTLLRREGFEQVVDDVAWAYDESFLAALLSHKLVIWDTSPFHIIHEYTDEVSGENDIDWSPNQNLLAVATWNAIDIYQVSEEEITLEWTISTIEAIEALAWSPDGTKIALGNYRGEVQIIDVQNMSSLRQWQAHSEVITGINWSSDGRYLVSAGQDKYARVWNPSTGGMIYSLEHHVGVHSAAWTFDDGVLVTDACTTYVWDLPLN
jgi:WD40 repeat protein